MLCHPTRAVGGRDRVAVRPPPRVRRCHQGTCAKEPAGVVVLQRLLLVLLLIVVLLLATLLRCEVGAGAAGEGRGDERQHVAGGRGEFPVCKVLALRQGVHALRCTICVLLLPLLLWMLMRLRRPSVRFARPTLIFKLLL